MRQFPDGTYRFALSAKEALVVIIHACGYTSQPLDVFRPVAFPVHRESRIDTDRGSIVRPDRKRLYVLALDRSLDPAARSVFASWGIT